MIGVIVIVPPVGGLRADDASLPWRPLVAGSDDVCMLARAVAGALPVDEAATAVVIAPASDHARVRSELVDGLLLDEIEHVFAPADDLHATLPTTLRDAIALLPPAVDVVVVQDARRPLVASGVCDRLVETARAAGAAVPAVAPRDVVVTVVDGTVGPRTDDGARLVQGPLAARRNVLVDALGRSDGIDATARDDTSSWLARVLHGAGVSVSCVDGDDDNLLVRNDADASRALEVITRRAGDLPVVLARDSLPEDPLARTPAAGPSTAGI